MSSPHVMMLQVFDCAAVVWVRWGHRDNFPYFSIKTYLETEYLNNLAKLKLGVTTYFYIEK